MIRNILFDMDDVLCTYSFQARLDRLSAATGVPAVEIEALIFKSGFEERADSGEFTATEYIDEISRLLGVTMDRDVWVQARADTTIPNPLMVNLIHTLQQSHELALLTNNGWLMAEAAHIIVPEIQKIFGDRFFVSAQIRASKESVDAFTTLLPLLGWQSENTLFVDDYSPYIASAREAGLHTHQFTTIDSLKTDLSRLGVL